MKHSEQIEPTLHKLIRLHGQFDGLRKDRLDIMEEIGKLRFGIFSVERYTEENTSAIERIEDEIRALIGAVPPRPTRRSPTRSITSGLNG